MTEQERIGSRSLPPLVDGDVYGHLVVKIDEILWCKKCPGEVVVLLQWWGEVDSVTFRPGDISKYPESARYSKSIKYNIQTNLSLFEAYLKQCNKLKLLVVNDGSKEIIGHVEISYLLEHITKIQLQKYFPIVTSSGSRIGDLRVDFDLSMNSVPEESSKKTRKRSRRKTKLATNNFHRSSVEEEKSKQSKKGYISCPNRIINSKKSNNFLDVEMPESPKTNQVPPNTGRSDKSDCVLFDVLEKGKKLRDAMVMSVLEDSDIPDALNEELLLKREINLDSKNDVPYKSNYSKTNGELVTPHEGKLISNYLEGKAMKEEEEKLVLTTLHSGDLQENSELKQNDHHKKEGCCLMSKSSCPHSASDQAANTSDCHGIQTSCLNVAGKSIGNLMKKINCVRLTVDTLTLTSAGWKKINQAVDNKSKNVDTVPPPGATYFVECNFVEDSPRSQAQLWKASPLRFCSRRQIGDVVYFGQSSAHSLKPSQLLDELEDVNCLVCWRHLHQRVPSLLGTFRLASLVQGLETEDTLPVISDNVTVVGHIKLKLQLGKDKLYFGNSLLEDSSRDLQIEKKTLIDRNRDKTSQPKEVPQLNIKDLEHENVTGIKNREPKETSTVRSQIKSYSSSQVTPPLPNYVDIPLCTNCGQNMILTNAHNPNDTSLCASCTSLLRNHQSLVEPFFKINIPKNFTSKEKRHHEFLIGIDTVKGFPLFANVDDELSCYVDYKFPQIMTALKAEMCSETTSRVVAVEVQPCLASVHRHSLTLPVVLPLSPLLAACSSGVTLRLWLRYHKPTPRDHMVAMALLPMDELCLMELEFDERQQEIAITKVLELPLALVPSSVTAPYQKCPSTGTLRVTVTYSNFITPPPKLPTIMSERASGIDTEPNLMFSVADNHPEPEKQLFEQPKLKPISALLDRISASNSKQTLSEDELKAAKNRFWTGPFGKENVEKSINQLGNKDPTIQSEDPGLKAHLPLSDNITSDSNNRIESARESSQLGASRPVMKEDLDILAESIEQKFNRLQSDLLKEKQRGIAEMNSIVTGSKKLNSSLNGEVDDDFFSFHSPISSNSSMESLPFILGPPADFKDIQNTMACSKGKIISKLSSNKRVSDTIVGFLKEEKDNANYDSNDSVDKTDQKPETVKPKTFKAMIKIDRAVNLKAVKAPCNGKKGKVPPSSWVSFGIGDCCEQADCCGTNGIVCSGPRFTTPVIRRNHNPIWNLSWDIDLPIEYLQQETKRLVFSVFEEQLGVCVGRASASVAILRSGLPCLSTWLSIDDPQGACRGQLKVVVTPLEDLRHYQNCSVFDMEEDDFEEPKENEECNNHTENGVQKTPVFVASQTEVFLSGREGGRSVEESRNPSLNQMDNAEADDEEDLFLADDIISDYKNTLENNFRNEMAGLENLIKFLRVGSMTSELSFFRSTENKENLSSNPSPQYFGGEIRTSGTLDSYSNVTNMKSAPISHQALNHNSQKDRSQLDAPSDVVEKSGFQSQSSAQPSSEDILSKLLHQISTFQPPVVKITDNTCQTSAPETKDSSTETSDNVTQVEPDSSNPVCMKDASTETEDITDKRSPRKDSNSLTSSRHVCEELGNVLLKHFLSCKPLPVKVADNTTQTDVLDGTSTVNSSGVFMSGISVDTNRDDQTGNLRSQSDWKKSEAQTSCDRLEAIDNNIRDLELFFKQNLVPGKGHTSSDSSVASINNDLVGFGDKGNLRLANSQSDTESLESFSQITVFPSDIPGSSDLPDVQISGNSDITETSLRRRGTYVIEKPTQSLENLEEKPSGELI